MNVEEFEKAYMEKAFKPTLKIIKQFLPTMLFIGLFKLIYDSQGFEKTIFFILVFLLIRAGQISTTLQAILKQKK